MRGLPAVVLQLLDALLLLSAMLPDWTGRLDLCLGDTVPQAPDLIIRQAFHEKRDKLSAVQSQVTSISNFLTSRATRSPSRFRAKRSRATGFCSRHTVRIMVIEESPVSLFRS